jgi:hypothetical protein
MKTRFFPMLVQAAVLMVPAAVLAQTMYGVKESDPKVGTSVRVEIVRSPIPFDKKFDELTPEQMEVLRSKYNELGANDEPPFPADGMHDIGREIARLEAAKQFHGPLVMTVKVDEKGEGKSVAVYKSPDDDFAHSVAVVLMKAKYKPAKCAGNPCTMDFPLIVDLGSL